jgi:hypothetical protein
LRSLKYVLLATFAFAPIFLASPIVPRASAQVSIGIGVGGVEPVCPYGYYGYAPYRCSPYGYYGPEWFVGGRFIGAGGWYHGGPGFYGHVNHQYDPRFGYHGGRYSDPGGHYHTEAQHSHYVGHGH